jgi:hypothetical protein
LRVSGGVCEGLGRLDIPAKPVARARVARLLKDMLMCGVWGEVEAQLIQRIKGKEY